MIDWIVGLKLNYCQEQEYRHPLVGYCDHRGSNFKRRVAFYRKMGNVRAFTVGHLMFDTADDAVGLPY